MRMQILALSLVVTLAGLPTEAAEPVSIVIPDWVTVRKSLVTVGDVAQITGGQREDREFISGLDLDEFSGRLKGQSIGRKAIEYRISLAGYKNHEFKVSGPDRVGIAPARRALTASEIEKAIHDELTRLLPQGRESISVELSRPIAVKLPEVAVWESVRILGKPRTPIKGVGPVQMDVTISTQGETLLGLPMYFEIKPVAPLVLPSTAIGTSAATPVVQASVQSTEVMVKARQRVTMLVRSGALNVSAVGEAMQEGRLGQTIQVMNVDSKKMLSARVSGPAAVEIELGGSQ